MFLYSDQKKARTAARVCVCVFEHKWAKINKKKITGIYLINLQVWLLKKFKDNIWEQVLKPTKNSN